MYYEALLFITIFVQVLLFLAITGSGVISKERKRVFIGTSVLLVFAAIFEWLGVVLNGAPMETKIIHLIIKVLEFVVSPFVAVGDIAAIQRNKKWKPVYTLAVVHAILEILFAPFGLVIVIDSNNVYVRGPLYFIYILTYLITLIAVCVEVTKLCKEYQVRNKMLWIGWILFLFCCTTIQTVTSSVRIDWLCVGISNLIFYYNYADIIQRVDGLTGLLNRSCYRNHLDALSKSIYVIFFDVNKFKDINDNYGHNYGDVILEGVAQSISIAYSKYGRCYRIGGDEFCVLFDGDKSLLENCNAQFQEIINENRRNESRFPKIAIGIAQYNPDKENIVEAIERADEEMYKNKQAIKAKL